MRANRRFWSIATMLVVAAVFTIVPGRARADQESPCTVTANGSGGWTISCEPTNSAPPVSQKFNGGNGSNGGTGAIFFKPGKGGPGGKGGSPTLSFPSPVITPEAIELRLTRRAADQSVSANSIAADGPSPHRPPSAPGTVRLESRRRARP
jgi:hypothetical protein